MKNKICFLFGICLIILLCACTTHNKETVDTKKTEKIDQIVNTQDKKEPYKFSGNITIEPQVVIVKGNTNLKPGSKLLFVWQNQNLGEMVVKKDGSFKLTVDSGNFHLGDELAILFHPDIQTKKIQSIYGEKGQRLKGSFLYHYSKNGTDYNGLKAGTFIDDLQVQIKEQVIQSNKILEKQRQDFIEKRQSDNPKD